MEQAAAEVISYNKKAEAEAKKKTDTELKSE